MNLRTKWCVFGLMTWATLTGGAFAQSPNVSEGTVRLGKPRNAAVTQAAAFQDAEAQPADTEGSVQLGSQSAPDGSPVAQPVTPQPYQMPPVGTGANGMAGFTPVDRTFQPRFMFNSYGGGLYGYNAGYATGGAFIPFALDGGDSLLFVDVRGLMTYDSQGGGNVGAGWRWWMPEYDRITGLSGWFDNTNGGIGSNFSQMGVSFESLGRYVDYRINGYIPAGQNVHYGASTLGTNATSLGNNIVFVQSTQATQAYSGFDIETGGPLPILGRYGFKGYLGAYHFMGAATNASFTGISGRWIAQINEDVQFGMQMTSDHTFGLNTQFQVFVTLPDGRPSQWMRNLRVRDRMTQSVFRQFRAITHTDTIQTFQAAINPNTEKPYFVAYVNPNDSSAGTGTNENPFNSIAQYNALSAAQRSQYDILVVNGRIDGTSTHLDTGASNSSPTAGLQLFNNQQLWSAASTNTFTTSNGSFTFLSNEKTATPILVNNEGGPLNGAVVTLANNNSVTGFTINGANPSGVQNNGIVSQSGGITGNFNISNNTFENTLAAVQLTHSDASLGLLVNNIVTGGPASGLAIGSQSNLGLSVTQTAGTLDLLANNNSVTNVRGGDATGTPTLGVGLQFIANGSTAVINADDPSSTTQKLGILNNAVTGSGAGLQIEALNGGTFLAAVQTNQLSSNLTGAAVTPTAGFGFAASAIGAGSTMMIDSYTNNTTSKNEGDGAVFTANTGGLLTVTTAISGTTTGAAATGDTFSNNDGDGMRLQADGGTIVMAGINGVTFGSNGGNGLNLVTTNSGLITVTSPLTSDVFSSNGQSGLLVNAQSGTINVTVDNATDASTFNGNGTNTLTGGDGLLFETMTGGIINTDIAGVTANNNANDGIGFNLNGGIINVFSAANPTTTGIQSSTATGNGGNGLSIVNGSGGMFTTGEIGGLTSAVGNNFSNNTGAGLFFGGSQAFPFAQNSIIVIGNNDFNRNTKGTDGILFNTLSVFTGNFTVAGGAPISIVENTFVGSKTAGEGIGGTVNGGGVNLAIGDANIADTNTFTSNTGADVGLILSGTSINSIQIQNENLSNVVNGTDSNFAGVGVGLLVQNSATLTGYIEQSTISNNASYGIHMTVSSTDPADFGQINNFVIGGNSAAFANTINSNGNSGIEIERTTNGQVNNMQIGFNTIDSNAERGIFISATNANTQDTYSIFNNTIDNNGNVSAFDASGIAMVVQADAILDVNITNNIIDGNAHDGIHTFETSNNPQDLREILGIWTGNTIQNNTLDGIELGAAMGNPGSTDTLVIGDPVDPTLGNNISNNGRNGINIEGAGNVLIGNNTISNNGTTGTVSTSTESAGIMAQVAPISDVTIINNQITNNIGDGIQYAIAAQFSGATNWTSQLQILDNNIAFNQARGVNILNMGNNYIQVAMTGNTVNGNGLEGVYVVNTTATDQTLWASSSLNLSQDGNPFFNPIIEMQFANNTVTGNGFSSTNQAGTGVTGPPSAEGLWVRVGTSGATNEYGFLGGFASSGVTIPVGGTPFGDNSGLGGVTMTVDNNTFGGNFGSDVLFQSFTSTTNPAATAGTWNATTYTVKSYTSDPLSRLDLYFRNNTFDQNVTTGDIEADVNNQNGIGNFANIPGGAAQAQFTAYYNNADTFKSPATGQTPPGPFTVDTRVRNAAARSTRRRHRRRYRVPFRSWPQFLPSQWRQCDSILRS